MPHKHKHRHYCDEDNPHHCVVKKPRPRQRKPCNTHPLDIAPQLMSTELLFKNALIISWPPIQMTVWTPSEISMMITLCCASLASVLYSVHRSRCTHIHICGCIDCERQVMSPADLENPQPPDPPIDSPTMFANSQSALQRLSTSSVRDEVVRLNARS